MSNQISKSLTSPEAKLFENKLPAGEELHWVGRPLRGRFPLRTIDYLVLGVTFLFTVLIGLYFNAYAVLFIYPTTLELKLSVLGFLVLPVATVLLTYSDDIQKRKRAVFAVTSHRIILMNELSGRMNEVQIAKLKDLKHKPREDGRGTVAFRAPLMSALTEGNSSNRGKKSPPNLTKGLPWIENSEEVHALIDRLHKGGKS